MFSDPESNLKNLGVAPGMVVADFGAGSGFYALTAAKMVSPGGKVYAVEVQKDLLERLKSAASREGFHDLKVIWGDIEKLGGTHLKDFSVDAVIISNVLFQVEDKEGLVKEARRILKPGGKVLLIDWSDTSDIGAPGADNLVSKNMAESLFSASKFKMEKEIEAGAHHYGIIFEKV